MRAWFLRVVANAVRLHPGSEAARRTKENERPGGKVSYPGGALLRTGTDPARGCGDTGGPGPDRTVSLFVSTGLKRLRARLAKTGYTAAPAVVTGVLPQTAPPVPAGLAAEIEKLVFRRNDGRGKFGGDVRREGRDGRESGCRNRA